MEGLSVPRAGEERRMSSGPYWCAGRYGKLSRQKSSSAVPPQMSSPCIPFRAIENTIEYAGNEDTFGRKLPLAWGSVLDSRESVVVRAA